MRRLAILVAAMVCLAAPPSASAALDPFGLLGKWGGPGSAANRFDHPVGVAVDYLQLVHVVDQGNLRTQLFAGGGGFLSVFGNGVNGGSSYEQCNSGCRAGTPSTAEGDLAAGPTGIAQGPPGPKTFVADTGGNRVNVYHPDGTSSSTIGAGTGALDGQMTHPTGVAVGPNDGAVYVVDQGNRRIEKFTSSGVFDRTWGKDVVPSNAETGFELCTSGCKSGESGVLGGEFENPVDIAVDSSQNVYVTDDSQHTVQKFNQNGTFIAMWGKNVHGVSDHVCTTASTTCTGGTSGTAEGEFQSPEGIGIDGIGIGNDVVYVVDSSNNRVEQFDASGSVTRTFGWGVSGGTGFEVCTLACHAGIAGSGDGQFSNPQRVGVDPGGTAYVSDTGNNRIERFGVLHTVANGPDLESAFLGASPYETILLQPGDYALSATASPSGLVIAPDPSTNGNARNITIDAPHNKRAFDVTSGLSSISGVTIKDGFTFGDGGGIRVQDGAFLYLQDSAVSHSEAHTDGSRSWGGGIFNAGELHATNVTLSQNSSVGDDSAGHDGFGGAIATVTDGAQAKTWLINATISGNTARQAAAGATQASAGGGGIYTDDASVTRVVNSTIAGNTVSGTLSGSGGGGNVFAGGVGVASTFLTNTIVAGGSSNRAGTENCEPGSGGVVSLGGNVEDRNQCDFSKPSDRVNAAVGLLALANNGGPIDTRALALTSPAIDAALSFPCNVFDARGFARRTASNPLCDSGAVEQGKRAKPIGPTPGSAPKCTLATSGSKVKAPKPRTLKLKATCDKTAALKLTGKLKVKPKKKKGSKKKAKAKRFTLSASGSATQPDKPVTLTVKVSKKAIKLLKKKGKGSIDFTMAASNSIGTTNSSAKIKKLKLSIKKKKHKKH